MPFFHISLKTQKINVSFLLLYSCTRYCVAFAISFALFLLSLLVICIYELVFAYFCCVLCMGELVGC